MFASSTRLGLGITVGPEKPGHIKTILSSPLPIFIKYMPMYRDITSSALWRMRAALKHRVREIAFSGSSANFDKFFKETKCTFPELESLVLGFGFHDEPKLPISFLGPDPSNSQLRRLKLDHVSLSLISGFLLSATALTDLSLQIDTGFSPSQETSLLACLQGMPCLHSLSLTILSDFPMQPSTPKDIILLPKLTFFYYGGYNLLLDALVAGLSAPSLRDVDINFFGVFQPPIGHIPRFISEIREYYYAIYVAFNVWGFRLSLLTRSEYISHSNSRSRFELQVSNHESLVRISGVLSTKFTTVEELHFTFDREAAIYSTNFGGDYILWREFYQSFPNVKALRTKGAKNTQWMAQFFSQDHGEPVDLSLLPALEEIDLGKESLIHRNKRNSRLETFSQFVSARQEAGHPVKVFYSA